MPTPCVSAHRQAIFRFRISHLRIPSTRVEKALGAKHEGKFE